VKLSVRYFIAGAEVVCEQYTAELSSDHV